MQEYGANRDIHGNTRSPTQTPDLAARPLQQFEVWLQQALAGAVEDATAATVATVMGPGSLRRVVLLKEFDQRGFVWFSDARSEKGQALAANPKAELMFYWRRWSADTHWDGKSHIRGTTSVFPFAATASQLAAATSVQSQPIESRAA